MKLGAITATILAAVLAVPVTAAQASPADPVELSSCGGELMIDQSTGTPGVEISIPGVIECEPPVPGKEFFVAVFEEKESVGYFHRRLMHKHDPLEEKTEFLLNGVTIGFLVRNVGLCLMQDERTRLSCVYVSTDMIAAPLSMSDPLVLKDVVLLNGVEINPNCGSCWSVVDRPR